MAISRTASERSTIASFKSLDMMVAAAALEAEGRRICRLEIGQPAGGAPEVSRKALADALSDPLGYTLALGKPSLRKRIAAWCADRYGVSIDPARVIVTTGSSTAFQLAFLAAFDPGARLGIADPSYASYRAIARALGLAPTRLEKHAETDWRLTPSVVESAGGPLDGLLVASPNNPTGATLDRAGLASVIDAAHAQGALVISDEIYHGVEYDGRTPSALEISDDVIVINSFSKYFRLTGWRIGWMIAPETLLPAIERLAQNLYICPPHASQVAAEASFAATRDFDHDVTGYQRNRDQAVSAFKALGFGDVRTPGGGFYLYASVDEHLRPGEDSVAWCMTALREAGVALAPGVDFDPVRGASTIRLSFCGAAADVDEGLERLGDWLRAR